MSLCLFMSVVLILKAAWHCCRPLVLVFRRVQVKLQVDVLHRTLSVWLGIQLCLRKTYPRHARPIALLFS